MLSPPPTLYLILLFSFPLPFILLAVCIIFWVLTALTSTSISNSNSEQVLLGKKELAKLPILLWFLLLFLSYVSPSLEMPKTCSIPEYGLQYADDPMYDVRSVLILNVGEKWRKTYWMSSCSYVLHNQSNQEVVQRFTSPFFSANVFVLCCILYRYVSVCVCVCVYMNVSLSAITIRIDCMGVAVSLNSMTSFYFVPSVVSAVFVPKLCCIRKKLTKNLI